MKKNLNLSVIITSVILFGCNTKDPQPIKLVKLNTQKLLTPGEWINDKDSMDGISIRENKIALFKNMEFNSDDIYEYELIDSIYKLSDQENKVGEYIMAKGFKDTLYYEVLNKSGNSLILKVNNQTKTYNLKKKAK